MAIIDSKIAEEAQRQAREYAQRNDTAAAHDWQQPPPAYEEAPVATASSSQPEQLDAAAAEVVRGEVEEPRTLSPGQNGDDLEASNRSNESTPLLGRRQGRRIRRYSHSDRKRKIKKGMMHFMGLLLLACIILLVIDLTNTKHHEEVWPVPIESDGQPIEKPSWSPSVKTNPDYWPNPNTPLWSSSTNFTFDAFKRHFLHAYGNGTIDSGQVSIFSAGPIPDRDWKMINRGRFYDRILVRVEARYTEVALRDAIRVYKMQKGPDKEGVGIYGAEPRRKAKNPYISFHVSVALPSERQRTSEGLLAEDGSSYISDLDIEVDNMRIGIGGMLDTPEASRGRITFGSLTTRQSNGGLTLARGLRANDSIDIHLQNGPIVDVKAKDEIVSMLSPKISINAVNGPIVLNEVLARDYIHFTTANGAIDISEIAIAKSIKIKQNLGSTAGWYRAEELDIQSVNSDSIINVDLKSNLYDGVVAPWEGEGGSVERHSSCQRRVVKVEADVGDVSIRYNNQDPQVQLDSSIKVQTGTIKVNHDRSFEGTFQASNNLGSLEIDEPGLEKPQKNFVITTDKRTAVGVLLKGRTWWPQHHDWNDKSKFCSSFTDATMKIGHVEMHF